MKKTEPKFDYEAERMKQQHAINTNQIDKLTKDFYGSASLAFGFSSGFKAETTSLIKSHESVITSLNKRITELEKIIKISGLVEELDTTDVVKLPQTGSEILATGSFGDKQYIVNKVN